MEGISGILFNCQLQLVKKVELIFAFHITLQQHSCSSKVLCPTFRIFKATIILFLIYFDIIETLIFFRNLVKINLLETLKSLLRSYIT